MAKEWIMITDDDPMSLQVARDMLNEQEIRVSTACSGRDLLKFMKGHSPDLILLDIRMPEMDGFETFRQLRELEAGEGRRHTPVIFLTGENDSAAEERGLMMGASDYVRKPFVKDILLKRISNTIQNSRTIVTLTEEASTDKLTGFLNKAGAAGKMSALCGSETGMMAILDLDSFKLVNDIYGHEMGDRVLIAFADTVRKNTDKNDVLCRIGGDEFLIFCRDMKGKARVADLTERLNTQLLAACKELMGDDFGIPIGVSVGAVAVPEHGRDYQLLFPLADEVLYRVKRNGKHGCAVYEAAEKEEKRELTPEAEFARVTKILEERNTSDSPLWFGREAFTAAYRFAKRFLTQSDIPCARLLILLSSEGEGSGADPSEGVKAFEVFLDEHLSGKDMVFQCGSSEFFVFIPGRSEKDAGALAADIFSAWEQTEAGKEIKLRFHAQGADL
ncbi:MAG: diguanylate cyclase [Lachnospiraceae bacterium]|nr:diguanylate cyclase [Lachnospiraceae bacterium]